jgi:hypothetical protein
MGLRAGWIWQASMSSAWILSSLSRSCELIWFYGKTSDWRLSTEFDEVSDRLPARLQRQSRAAWLSSWRIRVFRSADTGICGPISSETALSDPASSFFILMSPCLLSSSQIQSAAVHPFPVPPQSPRHSQDSPFRRTLPASSSRHFRTSSTSDTHLSEVELSGLLVLNTLDLDESGVGSRVPLCSLVTENTSLDVETISMERRAQLFQLRGPR